MNSKSLKNDVKIDRKISYLYNIFILCKQILNYILYHNEF